MCLGKAAKPATRQNPGPSLRSVPRTEALCVALTWQDEVLALVDAQGLLQALLHSFDLLPAGQEAEDPTCKGLQA